MSLFTGYTDSNVAADGLNMKGDINMDFYQLSNIAAPSGKYDAVSHDWFIKNSHTSTVTYKYTGFTSLNQKRVPVYDHGNYYGSRVMHSAHLTTSSKLYVPNLSLDKDSTDYDMKFKFYARLIYNDNKIVEFDISSGGIELKTRPNFTVVLYNDYVKWIDLSIVVPLKSITQAPEDVRFIIIIVEQVRGNVGGHEFIVNCTLKEY